MTYLPSFHFIVLWLLCHTLIFNIGSNPLTPSTRLTYTSLFIRQTEIPHYTAPNAGPKRATTPLYGSRGSVGTSIKSLRNRSDPSKVIRDGTVIDSGPGTNFTVLLDESNKKLRCTLAGRLYLNKVRIWNKSRVKVEVDLIYPEIGRIVDRYAQLI
ncbi:uncharacterized protein TOT_010000566 [Theileria orientalis strain Shintoku]|uniref:Uncharacterized protein n=1 Tax=Theileria orientalis strain Shintoku TaxID=869250 RepID=J4DNK2_THEOR|nr:uncharacterized protein TOT_010000566 [Theileria orientalis strain Shintoku]BAM39104.1 uncharacterized protein TOT_010000566 [Theileria orientalis strain Shintoku]|eukprot:XP_009689405.1 uncharacterized protein TOT_010000566 [Theileria orientalis strain Shintoku]